MEEVQKEERKENRGDGRFIQRMYMRNIADIWTDIRIADIILNGNMQYCRYTRVIRNRLGR